MHIFIASEEYTFTMLEYSPMFSSEQSGIELALNSSEENIQSGGFIHD